MKRIAVLLPIVALVMAPMAFSQLSAPGADDTPTVGKKAPDFESPAGIAGQETIGLKDFTGRSKVLLAFYPADFTGG